MAYYATVLFTGSEPPVPRRIRIEAGNVLQAALSVELFRLGYIAGSGKNCEILDIASLSRSPRDALETATDFFGLYQELSK
jgi:hypothetical protein